MRSELYALQQAIVDSTLAQAYLITAPAPAAALRLAREFACSLFCERGDACGLCDGCKTFLSGNCVDYLEISSPDNSIRKEHLVGLADFVWFKSFLGAKRCVLIDGAHKLVVPMQNKLLKLLEDPPENVVFLLVTQFPDQLLQTVVSRCIRIALKPQSARELMLSLSGKLPPERAAVCAALCEGFAEEAYSLAGDDEYFELRKNALALCAKIGSGKPFSAFDAARDLLKFEKRVPESLEIMAQFFRDALFFRYTGCARFTPDADVSTFPFTSAQLGDIVKILLDSEEKKLICPGLASRGMLEAALLDITEVTKRCHRS